MAQFWATTNLLHIRSTVIWDTGICQFVSCTVSHLSFWCGETEHCYMHSESVHIKLFLYSFWESELKYKLNCFHPASLVTINWVYVLLHSSYVVLVGHGAGRDEWVLFILQHKTKRSAFKILVIVLLTVKTTSCCDFHTLYISSVSLYSLERCVTSLVTPFIISTIIFKSCASSFIPRYRKREPRGC